MRLEIDVFWSFRSPWSYLATPRLASWAEQYDLAVRFRPVYPIAIRTPDFFANVPPQWTTYFMTDLFRVAEYLELPLTWPKPDPVQFEMVDEKPNYSVEQPYIHRLTRLGEIAEDEGRGIQFALSVSRLIWAGTRDWHQGEHLSRAAADAGLDLATMDERAQREESRWEEAIQRNQQDHAKAGHWGVPTCAFQGEPFFGQDRLDVLLWRLKQHGLTER